MPSGIPSVVRHLSDLIIGGILSVAGTAHSFATSPNANGAASPWGQPMAMSLSVASTINASAPAAGSSAGTLDRQRAQRNPLPLNGTLNGSGGALYAGCGLSPTHQRHQHHIGMQRVFRGAGTSEFALNVLIMAAALPTFSPSQRILAASMSLARSMLTGDQAARSTSLQHGVTPVWSASMSADTATRWQLGQCHWRLRSGQIGR